MARRWGGEHEDSNERNANVVNLYLSPSPIVPAQIGLNVIDCGYRYRREQEGGAAGIAS